MSYLSLARLEFKHFSVACLGVEELYVEPGPLNVSNFQEKKHLLEGEATFSFSWDYLNVSLEWKQNSFGGWIPRRVKDSLLFMDIHGAGKGAAPDLMKHNPQIPSFHFKKYVSSICTYEVKFRRTVLPIMRQKLVCSPLPSFSKALHSVATTSPCFETGRHWGCNSTEIFLQIVPICGFSA